MHRSVFSSLEPTLLFRALLCRRAFPCIHCGCGPCPVRSSQAEGSALQRSAQHTQIHRRTMLLNKIISCQPPRTEWQVDRQGNARKQRLGNAKYRAGSQVRVGYAIRTRARLSPAACERNKSFEVRPSKSGWRGLHKRRACSCGTSTHASYRLSYGHDARIALDGASAGQF